MLELGTAEVDGKRPSRCDCSRERSVRFSLYLQYISFPDYEDISGERGNQNLMTESVYSGLIERDHVSE